jgi:hypothetical protein
MPAERRYALVLAALTPLALAAAPPPEPAQAQALSAADAELLEFIGEFNDAQGKFVDPFVIDGADRELRAAARAAEKKASEDEQKAVAATAPSAPSEAPPEKKP